MYFFQIVILNNLFECRSDLAPEIERVEKFLENFSV